MNAFQHKVDYLISNGYEFKLGEYINKGFEIFKKNPGGFIAYVIIYLAIISTASFIPFLSLVVQGPLTAGFYIMAKKVDKDEPYEFSDFFKGFDFLGQLILVSLVGGLLTLLGICLVIPAIYLAVAYTFAIPFVIFGKFEFWDALENSRKVATKQWFMLFAFFFVLALINMAGALFLCVGLLVTMPVGYCATYAAFDDIVGVSQDDEDDDFRMGEDFSEILDV